MVRRLVWLAILACALEGARAFTNQSLNSDKILQVAAGQSWLDGRGLTYPFSGPGGVVLRRPMTDWPPLYSAAFAGAQKATGNLFASIVVVDVLAAAVFAVAWTLILLRVAREEPRTAVATWTFWALGCTPLTFIPASDGAALALFSAAVACTMRGLERDRGRWWTAGAGLCAGAAVAMRYLYLPLLPIPLVPYFVRGRFDLRRSAAFVAGALPMLVWTAVSALAGDSPFWFNPIAQHGVHWQHVAVTAPFGAGVLGIHDSWRRAAEGFPALARALPTLFWLSTAAVMFAGFARAMRFRLTTASDPIAALWICSVLTVAITIAVVVALSARMENYPDGPSLSAEMRYFAPVYPFLLLAFVSWMFGAGRVPRLLATALLVCCAASTAFYRAGHLAATVTVHRDAQLWSRAGGAQTASVVDAVRQARPPNGELLYCDRDSRRRAVAVMAGAVAPAQACEAAPSDGPRLTAVERDGELSFVRSDGPSHSRSGTR